MDAELLLGRLDGVIRTGDGRWAARCPAHDDRSPSLSVRVDGDWLLFHCHAGCAPEDVLAAVGLTWSDLYADPWDAAFRIACAEGAHRARRKRLRRELVNGIDIAVERMILRIAAADLRAGRTLSIEDRGRVAVAQLRVEAANAERRR
ncbi:MAG: hypothetical protein K9L88_01230 [Chromatiaceae bacterium]|nr:hypothetical protein [Chromatiaceae bacterium]